MKSGEIYNWLDQGPAVLLMKCSIPDVFSEEEYLALIQTNTLSIDTWPQSPGWKIKLLVTDEIIDVHPDTLHKNTTIKEKTCGKN